MITVYGTLNCGRCSVVKTILENKGVEFKYEILDELTEVEQEEVLLNAQENGIGSFPIVADEEGNVIKDVEEI